jgi:hypothetical protein
MHQMHGSGSAAEILAVKDASKQGPIPSAWRPVFRDIVNSFVQGDFKVSAGVPGLSPVSDDVAEHIQAYIRDYGETLVELPEETWKSSVCIWTGHRWDAIVDLWTSREGRSDLVLQAFVTEIEGGFNFGIHMVYVP